MSPDLPERRIAELERQVALVNRKIAGATPEENRAFDSEVRRVRKAFRDRLAAAEREVADLVRNRPKFVSTFRPWTDPDRECHCPHQSWHEEGPDPHQRLIADDSDPALSSWKIQLQQANARLSVVRQETVDELAAFEASVKAAEGIGCALARPRWLAVTDHEAARYGPWKAWAFLAGEPSP
jgi:hypothetical protein